MGFILYFILACVAECLYFKIKHTKPNGPPVWCLFPVLGIFPFFCLPKSLFKPLFRYYLRHCPDVIVTRLLYPCVLVKNSAVQDVQNSEQCLSRPAHGLERAIAAITTGKSNWYVADHNSKEVPWNSIRKTNISTLHVLPKEQKFQKTAEVVDVFLKTIEDHQGKLWDYAIDMTFAKFRETTNVNLGSTFEVNNIQSFVKAMQQIIARKLTFIVVIAFIVPLRYIIMFEHLLPKLLRPSLIGKMYTKMTRRIVEQKIGDIHEPRDVVEAALHLMEPEAALDFIRDTMLFNMVATTHTTQHTTMASLSHISLHKRVQRNIHHELDRVVGSAPLSQEHLANLHYLKAAIHEAYRLCDPVPKVLRMTSAPARIGGCTLESNMRICLFIVSENFDPNNFPDPYAFVPERFLNEDGKFETNRAFNIFSRGKRMCSGVDIANMTNQLYIAKILQHFEIHPERADLEVPGYSGGVIGDPPYFPLKFVRRPGAPEIPPVVLESGMTAFVRQVVEEEMANS